MKYILFDDEKRNNLLPFTFTRPACDIRTGILTIREKWEFLLKTAVSSYTEPYLSVKYPTQEESINTYINGRLLPTEKLINAIENLQENESIFSSGNDLLAFRASGLTLPLNPGKLSKKVTDAEVRLIEWPWDIFQYNGEAIRADFAMITKGRTSEAIDKSNNLAGKESIFAEPGAKARFVTINAEEGPVYLGKDSELMEGTIVRGPFSLGVHSATKLGTKIYGPTTIGPHSKVGGELNNTVIFGYSNKAHDGFLGNSVLGEWCNIGADSNNSNLKNNYAPVKVWNYHKESFVSTGLQFCGLLMADHTKCGINTMFNTGTVAGVSANIFGAGFPRNFIPSFSWGGTTKLTTYGLNKALEVAELVMSRRHISLIQSDIDILTHIFQATEKYRQFLK